MSPSHPSPPTATLLTLPSELRNQIYLHLFSTPSQTPTSTTTPQNPRPQHALALLQTSRQIHHETHLLAFTLHPFTLQTHQTHPSTLSPKLAVLRKPLLHSIRHLRLSATVHDLRALNETWETLPFGCRNLHLSSLTIRPQNPASALVETDMDTDTDTSAAGVADVSNAHTLAYILAESLKRLRQVGRVVVVNEGFCGVGGWGLVYRALVWRLWRWGGGGSGFRLARGEGWFVVFLDGGCERKVIRDGEDEGEGCRGWEVVGREVGEEVVALIGGEGEGGEMGVRA
ncbi:hypothetical protein MBLNU230_g5204t1 [Neophaeotheca triangularis]